MTKPASKEAIKAIKIHRAQGWHLSFDVSPMLCVGTLDGYDEVEIWDSGEVVYRYHEDKIADAVDFIPHPRYT